METDHVTQKFQKLADEIQQMKAFMKTTYEKKCSEIEAKDELIEELNQELLEFKDCYYHL